MLQPTYLYEAKVIRWVDGDTVELVVDVGFYMTFGSEDHPIDYRLYGMDTPERGHEDYHKATAFAANLAPVGSTIIIKSMKDPSGNLTDNFGRYIAIVYGVDGTSVNEALVSAGLAIYSEY